MQLYDYIVYKSGSNYYAIKNIDGTISSNSNFTTLICSIHTALGATGGSIFLKPGTYTVPSQVTVTNPISIFGAGRGRTILQRTSTVLEASLSYGVANCDIANLTIDGNFAVSGDTGGCEIYAGGNDIHIFNVEVKNFGYSAVGFWDQTGIVIDNCVFSGLATTFGSIKSDFGVWAGDPAAECKIANTTITNTYYNAILACGRFFVSNCYFKGNSVDAGGAIIGAGPTRAVITTVQDCIFDRGGANSSAIEMDYGSYIITGNRITSQPHFGIVCNSGTHLFDNAIIKNNIIKNCGDNGIFIQGNQQNFVIEGNICYDDQVTPTQPYGIYLNADAMDYYIVKDNICYKNATGNLSDNGTGTHKIVSDNITHA